MVGSWSKKDTFCNTNAFSGLCDEIHTVTLPGTSIVTVSVNATSVQSIIPRTTVTITTTHTQRETASSVCRVQATLLNNPSGIKLAPMSPPPQQQPIAPADNPPIASRSPNNDNKNQDNEEEGDAMDNDADFPGA